MIEILDILFSGFRRLSRQNNHNIYEYSNNQKCGKGILFETFVGLLICPNIMHIGKKDKSSSDGRTDAWIYYNSLPMRPSICLEFFFTFAVICFINKFISFVHIRYSLCFRFYFQESNDYCIRMTKLSFIRMRCFLNSSFSTKKDFFNICFMYSFRLSLISATTYLTN